MFVRLRHRRTRRNNVRQCSCSFALGRMTHRRGVVTEREPAPDRGLGAKGLRQRADRAQGRGGSAQMVDPLMSYLRVSGRKTLIVRTDARMLASRSMRWGTRGAQMSREAASRGRRVGEYMPHAATALGVRGSAGKHAHMVGPTPRRSRSRAKRAGGGKNGALFCVRNARLSFSNPMKIGARHD